MFVSTGVLCVYTMYVCTKHGTVDCVQCVSSQTET